MRLGIYFTAMLLMVTGFASFGQTEKTVKKQPTAAQEQKIRQRSFYRQRLQVDSVTADQVSEAQDTYKNGLKAVMADTTLNDGGKRVKIQLLMEEKNQKLKSFLNAVQQQKLIPTVERTPKKNNGTDR